jgi:protein-disulfide isomerase
LQVSVLATLGDPQMSAKQTCRSDRLSIGLSNLIQVLTLSLHLAAAPTANAQASEKGCASATEGRHSAGAQKSADSSESGTISIKAEVGGDPFRGSAEAPVTIIEYGDYQCSFCRSFKREIYPHLEAAYVNTSKLKYIYRDLPLKSHQYAFYAARAAFCAKEQGKFWQMHNSIFDLEESFSETEILEQAQALGLRMQDFSGCLDDPRSESKIRRGIAEAGKLQIAVTPTFIVGTRETAIDSIEVRAVVVGTKTLADYKAIIDPLVAERDRADKCPSTATSYDAAPR